MTTSDDLFESSDKNKLNKVYRVPSKWTWFQMEQNIQFQAHGEGQNTMVSRSSFSLRLELYSGVFEIRKERTFMSWGLNVFLIIVRGGY